MKTHKILLLFCLLAASFSLVEGARRKNGSRHLSRRNPKAKITLGACSKRCKRLGGRCGKVFSVANSHLFFNRNFLYLA